MGPKKRSALAATSTANGSSASSQPYQQRRSHFVETGRWAAKGTRPVPEPSSISSVFSEVVLHGCKRVLLLPPKYRLYFYAFFLFFVSVVADYVPFPKSYFSQSSNIPNQYFVKLSWAWTFTLVGIYTYLTAVVYCCGSKKLIAQQFGRLALGTIVWFVSTNSFLAFEGFTGKCLIKEGEDLYSVKSRKLCSTKNGKWTSFDISGHCFLLIWCVLLITEEVKTIVNWDYIKDLIRNEEYHRAQVFNSASFLESETQLSHLTPEDFDKLKTSYKSFGNLAKVQVVVLTLLVFLWDLMICFTCIYFHIMIEKVLGGLVAVGWWYFLYHGFYTWRVPFSPGSPGSGALFKYSQGSSKSTLTANAPRAPNVPSNSGGSSEGLLNTPAQTYKNDAELPKFMGMPLVGLRRSPRLRGKREVGGGNSQEGEDGES